MKRRNPLKLRGPREMFRAAFIDVFVPADFALPASRRRDLVS
jgi:hypothetical protein